MSGSGTAVDEEHIRENFESSKKEKKHKHKKDKKHRRHKERQRSAPSEERELAKALAAESPAVESSARENGAKPTSDPSRQAEAAPVPAEADEDFLRDKRAERGTPESGEISGKEPTEATAVGGADPEVANSSRKRGAERDEAELETAKRLKSETDTEVEASKQGIGINLAENGLAEDVHSGGKSASPKSITIETNNHRKSRSPERHKHADSDTKKDYKGSTKERGKNGEVNERERDRHKVSSGHQDKARSQSRASSRGKERDDRHSRDRRPDDNRDHYRSRGDRHSSRDRREDERRHADRYDRRDDSRSRRDRDHRSRSRRREDSRSRRDNRDRDRARDRDRGRHHQEADRKRKSREKEDKEFEAQVIAKLEENAVDEDELIERRRRKRQELMAKLQQEKEAAEAVANPTASERQDPAKPLDVSEGVSAKASEPTDASSQLSPKRLLPPHSPMDLEEEPKEQGSESETEDEHGLDEGDEAQLFQQRREGQPGEQDGGQNNALTPVPSDERHKIANQGRQADEDEFDMFTAEKVDDMFGDAPVGAPVPLQKAPKRGLLDNYDDSEGYYNFQVGEIMNDRYEVFATHGKGVFSTVLRARDRKPVDEKGNPIPIIGSAFPEVAIKVIRANDIMSKAGQTEVVILRKLAGADPSGKYHIIRLLREFEYRHHLCLVFEPLESNLRQLTKKYGQGIGLRLDAVRSMAAQMLMALHLMKQCGVLHADIKPDNILINRGHNVVKICDFGSAMFMGNNELTPYLVSRFYRAPEIILGLHYDFPMDVWSIGCVIYELFTGRILFPGRSNNEMLKLMMDVKGAFPKKMLKKGEFALQHFEDDPAMSFCLMEMDPLTKRPTKRLVPNPTIKKDFRGHLGGQEGDTRQVSNLIDLLEKMMNLDPDKRITAKEALRHPFIKDGRAQSQRR